MRSSPGRREPEERERSEAREEQEGAEGGAGDSGEDIEKPRKDIPGLNHAFLIECCQQIIVKSNISLKIFEETLIGSTIYFRMPPHSTIINENFTETFASKEDSAFHCAERHTKLFCNFLILVTCHMEIKRLTIVNGKSGDNC